MSPLAVGEELVIDGQRIDVNVAGSVTGATLSRRFDGATRLELRIYDPRMELLRGRPGQPSPLSRPGRPSRGQQQFRRAPWERFSAARLDLDGISFRLAGGGFDYDAATREVTLSFEDELAVIMRGETAPVKVSRGQDTRAEFNGRLVRGALARASVPFSRSLADRYFSPQAGQREPIAEPKDEGRTKGFAKGKRIRIKSAAADGEQRRNLTIALTVADQLRAGERATLALIAAGITESEWRNLPGGTGTSTGVLQVTVETAAGITPRTVLDPRTGNVHGAVTHDATGTIAPGNLDPRDVKQVVRTFLLRGYGGAGGAIKYATQNPDAEIYEIAQAVQASGAGRASNGQANYGPWVQQARDILDAWGGTGRLHTIRESYEFRAGGKRNRSTQNYWDDSGASADEVHWRRFCDRNRVWFVPDEWLFERQPTIHIDGEDGPEGLAAQGIVGIRTTGFDVGLPTADILIDCFLPRWGGPPGAVVEIDDLGPLDGRWLIASNDQDLLAAPVERSLLTLQRPRPKRKEPAPDTNTVQLTETRPEAGSMREAIVAAAERAHRENHNYFYLAEHRPMHESLFDPLPANAAGPVRPKGMDCSEFVTLVYKAADAPDPNGSGYNGLGSTESLRANGKKTSDPQPGDLAHYGSGAAGPHSHVGVYVGNGKVIEMGGTPGPLKLKVHYRTDFAGYWTYDLGAGQ